MSNVHVQRHRHGVALMTESIVDWRGNEYAVGDIVVYPTGQGTQITMNEAMVVEIIDYETALGKNAVKLKVRTFRKADNYGVRSPGGGRFTWEKWGVSTLTNIVRVMKVVS